MSKKVDFFEMSKKVDFLDLLKMFVGQLDKIVKAVAKASF